MNLCIAKNASIYNFAWRVDAQNSEHTRPQIRRAGHVFKPNMKVLFENVQFSCYIQSKKKIDY